MSYVPISRIELKVWGFVSESVEATRRLREVFGDKIGEVRRKMRASRVLNA